MADSKVADSTANEEAHWDKTTKLMLTHLGIWFFFGYVIHMFVVPLNKITIPILAPRTSSDVIISDLESDGDAEVGFLCRPNRRVKYHAINEFRGFRLRLASGGRRP